MYNSMFGTQTLTGNSLAAVESYEITRDNVGVFSFLFRLIQSYATSKELKISDKSVWADALLLAQNQFSQIDASSIINDQAKDQKPQQMIVNIIKSMPSQLRQLFEYESFCTKCHQNQNTFEFTENIVCKNCATKCRILKYPDIIITTGNLEEAKTVGRGNYKLSGVLTQHHTGFYSILVDIQSRFVFQDVSKKLSKTALTYLKPQLVQQYLSQTSSALKTKIGPAVTSVYICQSRDDEPMAFNDLVGDTNAPKVVQKLIPMTLKPAVEQKLKPLIINTKKSVHLCQITWVVWLLLAVSAAMMIATIAMLAVLQNWKTNSITFNDLTVDGELFVGLQQNVTDQASAQSYATNISALLTSKAQSQLTKQASLTYFDVYASQIDASYINATQTTVLNDTSQNIVCSQTSVNVDTFDATNTPIKSLTAQTATVETLTAPDFQFTTTDVSSFPVIQNLVVDNLVADTMYSKELNASVLITDQLAVLANLSSTTITAQSAQATTTETATLQSGSITAATVSTGQLQSTNVSITMGQLSSNNITFSNQSNATFAAINLVSLNMTGETLNIQILNATTVTASNFTSKSVSATSFIANATSTTTLTSSQLSGQSLTCTSTVVSDLTSDNMTTSQLLASFLNVSDAVFSVNKLIVGDLQISPGQIQSNTSLAIQNVTSIASPIAFGNLTTGGVATKSAGGQQLNTAQLMTQSLLTSNLVVNSTNVSGDVTVAKITSDELNLEMAGGAKRKIWGPEGLVVDFMVVGEFCQLNQPDSCACQL